MAAVTVSGLSKSYGAHVALRDLELTVPAGSVYGLLGPNGAGKSTTFGILCGWLRADAGNVQVLGVDVAHIASLSGRIAALPQDAFFAPNLSIVREIAHYARMAGVPSSKAHAAAIEALTAVGLEDALDKTGGQLSHGMAKRAGLAQCLVGNPDLVLLDEPTAGLDPRHARGVRDIIHALGARATVIVSSHNLAEIEDVCTHGAILDRGRLTLQGTIDALTNRGELVRIELVAGDSIPLEAIAALPMVASAQVEQTRFIELQGESGVASSEVIGAALRVLLDAGCGVLGVERGRSLERAFLDLTAPKAP